MTDDENIAAQMAAELATHPPVEVVLTAAGAVQLIGLLQLVLRHPLIGSGSRATAAEIVDQLRTYFADAPITLDIIRRGDDPRQDRPWGES